MDAEVVTRAEREARIERRAAEIHRQRCRWCPCPMGLSVEANAVYAEQHAANVKAGIIGLPLPPT